MLAQAQAQDLHKLNLLDISCGGCEQRMPRSNVSVPPYHRPCQTWPD